MKLISTDFHTPPDDQDSHVEDPIRIAALANAMGRDGHPPSDADMERIAQVVRDVAGTLVGCSSSSHWSSFLLLGGFSQYT